MKTIIIISILVYLISAIVTWKWFRIAFSPKGIWESLTPSLTEIFIVVCPVLNTINTFIVMFKTPFKERSNKDKSSFFNLKK